MKEPRPKAIDKTPSIRTLHRCCSHRSVILGACRPFHEFSAHRR